MFGCWRGFRGALASLFPTQQLWLNESIPKCSPLFARVWAASTAASSPTTWPLSSRYSPGLNGKTHKNAAVAEPLPPRSDAGKAPELNSNSLCLPWQTSDLRVHSSHLGRTTHTHSPTFLLVMCLAVPRSLCNLKKRENKCFFNHIPRLHVEMDTLSSLLLLLLLEFWSWEEEDEETCP